MPIRGMWLTRYLQWTEAYEYIWDIIHGVYGDAYDEEYVG